MSTQTLFNYFIFFQKFSTFLPFSKEPINPKGEDADKISTASVFEERIQMVNLELQQLEIERQNELDR